MKSDLVTVLDLGSTKAAALAAEFDEKGGIRVVAASSVPCKGIKKGVVTDLDETARCIDAVLRRVREKLEGEVGGLVIGIGGQHIEGVNAQGFVPIYPRSRQITREDVLQVINHSRQHVLPPDREQIQSLPKEFRIDGQRGIQRPIGMNGSKLEAVTYIVTGQTTHIQNLEKAVQMAGHKVEQMVLQPLASGLAVLSAEEIQIGSVVVDIGGGTTDVAVFNGGSIAYSACVPLGSQHITSDISKLLKTSPEEAERLKIEHGAALARLTKETDPVDVLQVGQTQARPLQRRVLCEIIESRVREIATMVRQQIEKSGLFAMLPGGIVLTGGGSALEGTAELFQDVHKHLRARVAAPQVEGPEGPNANRLDMATAVGLARFTLECCQDELAPAGGVSDWKEKIRTFLGRF
jgi:cell division protein FtsA